MVMGEKLCLVGRQVDRDGALGLAALACQTQVERLLYLLAAPSILDDFAVGHLPEQVGTTPSRVLFLARYPEARAHDPAFIATALADSDTAQGGVCQAAVILWKLEMCGRPPRVGVRTEAKILVHAIGLDDFPGVHLPIRI